ncbi:transposase [Aliamphritea hakodatensis]|uniref:transposase n=1 Tax=Aliamphritea hakodatensis TaxID=2895352 RepID=UPI0022FD67DB|nr:transposase [Aliamphritea hakodatensis]
MKSRSAIIEQALFMAECGVLASTICDRLKITDTTFYNWKRRFNGLNAAAIDQLTDLQQRNRLLQKQVEQLNLDKQILQDVLCNSLQTEHREQKIPGILESQPVTNNRARQLMLLK